MGGFYWGHGPATRMSDHIDGSAGDQQRLMTVASAAQFLGCSEANVYALIRGGELPYVTIGRSKGFRLDRADLEAFIEHRKQQRAATVRRPSRPRLKHIKLPPR